MENIEQIQDVEEVLTSEQKIMLCKILNEYKIDIQDEFYKKCKEIYIQSIKISNKLLIKHDDYINEDMKISHYAQKNTADKLFITLSKFRLYNIIGMNDPSEGDVLFPFFNIPIESFKSNYLPFISCFSLDNDSLNQFRLYGKEENKEATGVSINFKDSFVRKYNLYRCIYVDKNNNSIKSVSGDYLFKNKSQESQEYLENIPDRTIEVQELFNGLKTIINGFEKINLLTDLLVNIRYLVKDYAFITEQECRIIDIKERSDNGGINIEKNRLYIETDEIKKEEDVDKIIFAPLSEGMEAFEIKTGIECIRSRHQFKQ